MTLLKDYLNEWTTFEDERFHLLKKLDSSIMKAMLKNNIPLNEVKNPLEIIALYAKKNLLQK